jgi:hypothetical protein
MSKKAAEHHKQSAEHHTHAARHHGEAAKHHEAGQHEKAARRLQDWCRSKNDLEAREDLFLLPRERFSAIVVWRRREMFAKNWPAGRLESL